LCLQHDRYVGNGENNWAGENEVVGKFVECFLAKIWTSKAIADEARLFRVLLKVAQLIVRPPTAFCKSMAHWA
jgi:hypothetical protein